MDHQHGPSLPPSARRASVAPPFQPSYLCARWDHSMSAGGFDRLVGGPRYYRSAMVSPLDRFSPLAREWFESAFAEPTPAQVGAWDAVSSGQDALVVAPTGSGKTLAAFLWAIDRLAA